MPKNREDHWLDSDEFDLELGEMLERDKIRRRLEGKEGWEGYEELREHLISRGVFSEKMQEVLDLIVECRKLRYLPKINALRVTVATTSQLPYNKPR